MILLEPMNRIIQETIQAQLELAPEGEEKRDPIDVRLCDFDDVSYRIQIEAENRDVLLLSMASPCLSQIMEKGADDQLKEIYGDWVVDPIGGMNVTLSVDLTTVKGKEKEIADKLAMLKPNVCGGVFHFYTKNLKNDTGDTEPFQFQLRGDTTVYVFPAKDRVVFIYSMHFDDLAENCIGKVFMQEFVDAKKKIGKAPPVNFSKEPPRELQEKLDIKDANCNLGYISFAILKPHCADERLRNRVCELLQTFRTYTQYHIKCSKSYFHSRMRARAVELLKVLARARIEEGDDQSKEKVKRTAGGKVFKRS